MTGEKPNNAQHRTPGHRRNDCGAASLVLWKNQAPGRAPWEGASALIKTRKGAVVGTPAAPGARIMRRAEVRHRTGLSYPDDLPADGRGPVPSPGPSASSPSAGSRTRSTTGSPIASPRATGGARHERAPGNSSLDPLAVWRPGLFDLTRPAAE